MRRGKRADPDRPPDTRDASGPRVRVRTPMSTRMVLPVLATVLFVGILVVGVFPTRSYLNQKRSIATAAQQLHALSASNAAMRAQVKRLGTDAEIEQQARQNYDLVKPGEEVYRVLPAPQAPVPVPDVWPFSAIGHRVNQ